VWNALSCKSATIWGEMQIKFWGSEISPHPPWMYLGTRWTWELKHNRRSSNVFGDARFWFRPNRTKFAQKIMLLNAAASPAPHNTKLKHVSGLEDVAVPVISKSIFNAYFGFSNGSGLSLAFPAGSFSASSDDSKLISASTLPCNVLLVVTFKFFKSSSLNDI